MKQLLTLKKTLALLLAAALLLPFFAWAAPLEPLQPEEAAIAAISDEIIEEEITMAAAITPGIDLPVKSAILMDQASRPPGRSSTLKMRTSSFPPPPSPR